MCKFLCESVKLINIYELLKGLLNYGPGVFNSFSSNVPLLEGRVASAISFSLKRKQIFLRSQTPARKCKKLH